VAPSECLLTALSIACSQEKVCDGRRTPPFAVRTENWGKTGDGKLGTDGTFPPFIKLKRIIKSHERVT
jgi:hypothetical protein